MNEVLELLGIATESTHDWRSIVSRQRCPYLTTKCTKLRKSEPEIAIGTCSVSYGRNPRRRILICPIRFLERHQIFLDCIHLLSLHEPGNELHIVPEVAVPGGKVDYVLTSVRHGVVKDFVGIELQTLDTTGSVWPARQRFLLSENVIDEDDLVDADHSKRYGINWKMTAKTILIQLHHKIQTFEAISKRLVLIVQDHLLSYLESNFVFQHVRNARTGDAMQFHAYEIAESQGDFRINLSSRLSTDAEGLAKCLGLKAEAKIALSELTEQIEQRISTNTLLKI